MGQVRRERPTGPKGEKERGEGVLEFFFLNSFQIHFEKLHSNNKTMH
jgi:hypothetical protein